LFRIDSDRARFREIVRGRLARVRHRGAQLVDLRLRPGVHELVSALGALDEVAHLLQGAQVGIEVRHGDAWGRIAAQSFCSALPLPADLAGALAKSGQAARAVPYFERAIAAGGESALALNGLGFARLEAGDGAGGLAALRRSLALDPRQPQVADVVQQISGARR